MAGAGAGMAEDIAEQPAVFARLLAPESAAAIARVAARIAETQPRHVVFTARGTSDHAALYGAYLTEIRLGVPAGLASPSSVTVYGARPDLSSALVVGVSQSGGSPDLVEVVTQARASELLASGAARDALDRIIDAQGRRQPPVLPGSHMQAVKADRSGIVTGVDGWVVAGVARRAGAPSDLRSGLDLVAAVGDAVKAGDPLYVIHAGTESDASAAAMLAQAAHGYRISG